ncbi:putative chaperone DNAJ protein [Trypanosoma grayi]|uniref:putative chaperone DNAJ protein n=1 Tax=Trypanosoma grayi TaxID=71804 RepID=UPI0004F3FCA0|nr:putative chaperone DNAJ protein [Trypanosoma grayi]KEG14038.1 putative chaperone DNAJ protein [Trypanosoma grayi]
MRRSWRVLRAAERGPFDPYRILGLAPNASKEEVKKAYHRLALRYHPDGGPEGSKERFQAVNEAYEALKDGRWRKHDADGEGPTGGGGRHGWDPKMGMYVYEQPGSTTENYVDSRTQTLLRLCVLWTTAFVVVRFFLLWVFPFAGNAPTVEWIADSDGNGVRVASATDGNGKGDMAGTSSNSVHANEDAEFMRAYSAPFSVGASTGDDPLRRS